ncbi:MAG: UpxY family transcription antiterminator [Paludibacteraceae bacterium]|nr:UpxY family transcription antiterminator [Paludibacteraceae bacterium]
MSTKQPMGPDSCKPSLEEPLSQSIDKTAVGWYVMKVLWRQEVKTQQRFAEFGLESYVPMRQILCEDARHRKQRVMVPAINGLVFVFSSIKKLEEVKEFVRINYGQTVYFYTNHVGGRNVITSIPEKQMADFRSACDIAGDEVRFFLPEELELSRGTRVRIHGGPFEGREGVLLKVKGKRSKSLVVSIEGFISAVVADISPEFIEKLS